MKPNTHIAVAPSRRIVLLALPGCQAMDIALLSDTFIMANEKLRVAGKCHLTGYSVHVCALDLSPVRTASGIQVVPDGSFAALEGAVDTIVIIGGATLQDGGPDARLAYLLSSWSKRVSRVASVTTGSYLLAKAGPLEGKRATVHWFFAQHLADAHPEVRVQEQAIIVRDGRTVTCAGAIASVDLALALIEHNFGDQIAMMVAHAFLLFSRRHDGQAQLSSVLKSQAQSQNKLRELPVYILEHIGERLSVEHLADRVGMSPRTFSRHFTNTFRQTPAAYVLALRLETAQRMLLEARHDLEHVATNCGFASGGVMRLAFHRALHAGPAHVRERLRHQPTGEPGTESKTSLGNSISGAERIR